MSVITTSTNSSCFSIFSSAVLFYWQLISFKLHIKTSFFQRTCLFWRHFRHIQEQTCSSDLLQAQRSSITLQHLFSLFSSCFLLFFCLWKTAFVRQALMGTVVWLTLPMDSLCPAHFLSSPTPKAAFCSPTPAPLTRVFLPAPRHLCHLLTWFRSRVDPSDPGVGSFGQLKTWCQATHEM